MSDTEPQLRREGVRAAFRAQLYAGLCLAGALVGTALLEPLTSVLLVLSSFLFWVVCRYSKVYLMGDAGQPRFLFWLCVTGSCVFVLVLSGNLLLFSVAWCGISLSLHQLLQFYRDRQGALVAARKKFLISRLGDLALLGAVVMTYRQFGTWEFVSLTVSAERLRAAGAEIPMEVHILCGLVVFAALLKSAQFPFHSWLPDTMETPTPVSALMHAGIINAGGILILRFRGLVSLSEGAMVALCIAGGVTALFAAVVMLTQASVKRCLAFSTVGQMGFMMLECGLGAFHLALVHLVAHSLYKAHAFLSSGSVVHAKASVRPRSIPPVVIFGGLAGGLVFSLVTAALLEVAIADRLVLNGIFALAMAQMLWGLWSNGSRAWRIPLALVVVALSSLLYFAMERLAEAVVKPWNGAPHWSGLVILGLFVLVGIAQTQASAVARSSFGQHLYVHARNGFYLNTLASRATNALWPARV